MMIFLGKDRCPLCGSFGKKTGERNIYICKKCDAPFNEFGVSPLAKVDDIEVLDFRQQN